MSNRKGNSNRELLRIGVGQLYRISEVTIAHYDQFAEAYWDGTRDHDVSQNYTALLDAIEGDPPYSILDLGCGPGRDLHHFRTLGHDAVGLDGSKEFVALARAYSGCEVLHQDFLAMELPKGRFDGVFANASLFHVPEPRIAESVARTLRNLEAPGRSVLLKPERKQRGRLQR
jgi:SAM-dependent methyltransferase